MKAEGRAAVPRRRFFRFTAAAAASRLNVAPVRFQPRGASERIGIGVIGTGGRGTYLMKEAARLGCRIVGLCDVYEQRLRWAEAELRSSPEVRTAYFEKILHRNDIHAVINATPDHWHYHIVREAVAAGKDVYTEKPLAYSIEQGRALVGEVRKTDRVVQVGTQRRSGEHWERARHALAAGLIGQVTWVRVFDTRWWVRRDPFAGRSVDSKALNWQRFLGPAPPRKLDPYRYWAWRWFWDFSGGLLTDVGSHQFDLIHFLTDTAGPQTVAANGGVYYFHRWETPDVVHAAVDYGSFAAVFSAGFVNRYEGVGARFYGTEGTLVVGDKEFMLIRERTGAPPEKVRSWKRLPETRSHLENWLVCIRTRKEPKAPVEVGQQAAAVAHLGNLSYRRGMRVGWDPEKGAVRGEDR